LLKGLFARQKTGAQIACGDLFDELDALLQRMLSLPLNKSESVKVPPAPPLPVPEMPVPSNRPSVSLWRADTAPAPRSPYIAAEPEPAALVSVTEVAAGMPIVAVNAAGLSVARGSNVAAAREFAEWKIAAAPKRVR